ncbi:aspartate/glutamate racemase family protein [Kineosporia babensis]|uniref:Hydantoin racemase n=1 Tax=Kineosporia babensis TaxID=499548 RepID=A0A9X1NHV6_9ACTN|nr:aspartate/glutamate racemase family protein [Kineosporia babensis]MCD5314144.1 aspartate/glutamate racemase family protein [Kineosporia babensis]
MLIRVINPNTTASMTELIGRSARAVAHPGTVVEAVNPQCGPVSIESHYDEALAVPGLLAEIRRGEQDGVSAYVVACFGDPGLDAARELARGPVIGIAEAGMHAAAFLGRGFSVVTTLERTTGRAWDLARAYGFGERCLGVYSCDIPVLALETDPQARAVVTEQCRRALERDGSDAVVLGCAGMADLCAVIEDALGSPIVDGVAAATVFAESLVRLGLATGKHSEFARPPAKPYTGVLSAWGL